MDISFFQKRDIRVLNKEDRESELNLEKQSFSLDLYKEDLDFCRDNKLNISRIIRIEFHKWLKNEQSKP